MTASQKSAFVTAAAKWEEVITGDLPDVVLSQPVLDGECDARFQLPAGTVVDDIVIFASSADIDGPDGVLGSAGPCSVRQAGDALTVGDLPFVGSMFFDAADLEKLDANGDLYHVIRHEMGHVLGIGSLWDAFGLLKDKSSASAPLDTYFGGGNAIAAFDVVGGTGYTSRKVPVENGGGAGTINGHWREAVLGNELMTGFLNAGANPLSLVTVRSLQDLGYTVNAAAAESFAITPAIPSAPSGSVNRSMRLVETARRGPVFAVDRRGRRIRIR
jgi:hypothetical protein